MSPAIMGFATAIQFDVMFAFVGILFSVFGVSLRMGLMMRRLSESLSTSARLTNELQTSLAIETQLRAEAEQSVSNLTMVEAELSASVENLRRARYQLESKTLKQQEVFAIISHELQTPAAAIALIAAMGATGRNADQSCSAWRFVTRVCVLDLVAFHHKDINQRSWTAQLHSSKLAAKSITNEL